MFCDQRARCQNRLLSLSVLTILMIFSSQANAGKLQTYWTTNENVAKKIPKADGSNGWTKWTANNPIVVPGNIVNRDVWIAWRNETNASKHKFFRVEFLRLAGEKFTILEARGFLGDDDSNFIQAVGASRSKDSANPRVREYQFTPQPKWERIKIHNDEPIAVGDWNLQADAWSMCADIQPENIRTLAINGGTIGALAAMENSDTRTTQITISPIYVPIDVSVSPILTADPSTGTWDFEYVSTDHHGNPLPHDALQWSCEGPGLSTGDEFDTQIVGMDLVGPISVVIYDAETDSHHEFDVIDVGPPWIEPFDIYHPGDGVIDWRGWTGFNENQNVDAIVAPHNFLSPPHSLEVQQNTQVVRPFDGVDSGQWLFSTWTFVPGFYQGASSFSLFDEYQHNGPQHQALIGQFDSNLGQLHFLCGDPNPISVPYIVDQWVPIDVVIDLDNDGCELFYNHQPVCQYQWTAGAFADDNGLLQLAAVDLFASGSAPIFYDDMMLVPIEPPVLLGDVNLDGEVNLLDVDPFIDRIASGTFQEEADINGDGEVNLLDIDPFIAILGG